MFSSTAQAEVGKQSHSVLHSKFWPAWARDPVVKNNVFCFLHISKWLYKDFLNVPKELINV